MKRWLQNFFIPSVENGYRPNSLEKRAATIMLLLVITTFSVANLQSLFVQSSSWFLASILPAVLVDLTNTERGDGALAVLTRNEVLDHAAQLKAEDMAEKEYFAHDSPDGLSPWYFFEQAGYTYAYAGENLAVNFSDSDEVVDAWMNSPGHRANILKSQYSEIGIGTAKGMYKGTPTIFVVQLFGTPLEKIVQKTASLALNPSSVTPIQAIKAELKPDSNTTPELARASEVLPLVTEKRGEPTMYERYLANKAEPSATPLNAVLSVASESDEAPLPQFGTTLFSDIATTSVPFSATIAEAAGTGGSSPSGYIARPLDFMSRILASSHNVISFTYLLLSLFVALSLIFAVVFEWKRQHGMQVAYGVGLIATMALMLYVHIGVTGGLIIV